jgi:asparagine synthase (glutamine-hydrolysing)
MCGIAGIVNLTEGPPPDRDSLSRMLTALWHRGPDENGIYIDRYAGLAHTRLSIIDLTSGQQPLSDEEADPWWIVFNGEIFNYRELRSELAELGHSFHTHSDTEVLLRCWRQWGIDGLSKLNGQWAFAAWNPARRELVLSRDRLGVRPLFYAEHRGKVIFGSEVKALFAGAPELPRRFDANGLQETFTFWSTVAPSSVFEGVAELPPGAVRVYRGGNAHEQLYWQPDYTPSFQGDARDAAQAVERALLKATELRMLRADVDVGCYMSGGLDSSLIAALGLRAKGERFCTFSLRFKDAEFDETPFQRRMAAHLGTDHRELEVTRSDIAECFPQVITATERPVLRSAPAPLFLLSKKVRESGIKVVLTGEGADEMFAGYDIFREGVVRRFWARHPDSELRPRLLERLYPYLAQSPVAQRAMTRQFFGKDLARSQEPGFTHSTRWNTTSALNRLLTPEFRAQLQRDPVAGFLAALPETFATWSPLAKDQYIEVRTLLSGYLLSSQGDRMLMGNSVEGRFPFLDPDVVALANSLPSRFKLNGLKEKFILKWLGKQWVPQEVLDRPKQPYRAPDAASFIFESRPAYVDECLSEAATRDVGVFDANVVATLWQKCRTARHLSNTDNMALLAVLSTHLVHRQISTAPLPAPAPTIKTVHLKP